MNMGQTNELETVVQGNGEFSKNLYAVLSKEPGNIFFSPISIHTILSLVYQGAQGRTHEALTKALNVPDSKVAATGYKKVLSGLNSVPDVTLLMANKVFLQETYKLQNTFKAVAAQNFLSEVKQLNFKQPQDAATNINNWVMEKTKNKIQEVVSPDDITDQTALVLVNAIYFKGKWADPFEKRHTSPEKFYLNDVDTIEVQMMHIREDFFYKDDADLNAQVLELPYANRNISLIVVLPRNRNGIEELEKKLVTTDINKLTENMREREVVVALPKFKIEQTIDLEDPLTELGLGVIFSDKAEFPGIIESPEPLYVSKIVQKTFFEMHEEGSEAAAATVPRMRYLCSRRTERFMANRPFCFILISKEVAHKRNVPSLSNILFYGKLARPPIACTNPHGEL